MAKKSKIKSEKDKYLNIVPKVWGEEKWIVNRDYCGKILVLKKGFRCSYHCHKFKDETFYINKGKVLLEIGGENLKSAKKIILEEGFSHHIKPGLYHRFLGLKDSEIIEFSTNHSDKDSFRKTESSQALPANNFEKIIDNFPNAKVLVIGDIMLDQYVFTDAEKISQEAPILVAKVFQGKNLLGGAANTFNNLKDLGVNCSLIGVVGKDWDGNILKDIFKTKEVPIEGIFIDKTRVTTKKLRVIARNQQLLRIDYEDCFNIEKGLENKIFKFFSQVASNFKVVVLSDYAKGVLTYNLTRKIIDYCQRLGIKTVVDPKPSHRNFYGGARVLTPNLIEAMGLTGITDKSKVKEIGKKLQKEFGCDVVLTLGAAGMMVFEKKNIYKIRNVDQEVFRDVSGAGDTVVAVIAACLSNDVKLLTACKLANIAAGLEVRKFGTATVSRQELKDYLYYEK